MREGSFALADGDAGSFTVTDRIPSMLTLVIYVVFLADS